MPPSAAATMTASMERRPSSAQYTSRRFSHRAYSSSTRAAPHPNAVGISHHRNHGMSGSRATDTNPAPSSRKMPGTRWWIRVDPIVRFPGPNPCRTMWA